MNVKRKIKTKKILKITGTKNVQRDQRDSNQRSLRQIHQCSYSPRPATLPTALR